MLTVRPVPHKQVNVRVHQLIAEAFLGQQPVDMVVNHKDGDKSNNRINNLEYVTWSENSQDAWDTGLKSREQLSKTIRKSGHTRGEKNHRAKITEADVREIRRIRKEKGWGCRRVARKVGLPQDAVYHGTAGNSWMHVK